MQLLVFFDLPVVALTDRKNYARFRKFLLNDGYQMIQFSVYSRVCGGMDGVEKHRRRLSHNLPPKGFVRSLILTDKQFSAIEFLVGLEKKAESLRPDILTLF